MGLEELSLDEIAAFGNGVRERLHSRVAFNFNETPVPNDPEERALWYWSALLGLLTLEMSLSSQTLALAENLRGATVLNRALFEYWLRLRFYSKRRAEAVQDLDNHAARFKKLAEAFPTQYSDITPEQFAQAYADVEGDPINRRVSDMVRVMANDDPEIIGATYGWYYAMASMFAHGNEAAFFDLVRTDSNDLPVPSDDLDWKSKRLKKNDVIANSASWALYMLIEVEHISKRGAALALLRERFPKAFRALARD
jgi:hypothetical protein